MHNNNKKLNNIEFKIDSSKWNLVSEKGYPEEDCCCFVIFKSLRGGYDYFVGGYFPNKKEFWVNFGLGGAVIDEKDVVAWAPFDGDYLFMNDK